MNIEIDDTLKLEQFLLLCLHTDTNPVRNTKCGKSSKNSWNHLHCCLPDKLESMVLEFLSMERAKYVPIWNCFFCFKVALRLWFCRSIDHIFVLNQSRVLLVCLTLFLCEAKWHLLLDLLFVFCTKKVGKRKPAFGVKMFLYPSHVKHRNRTIIRTILLMVPLPKNGQKNDEEAKEGNSSLNGNNYIL